MVESFEQAPNCDQTVQRGDTVRKEEEMVEEGRGGGEWEDEVGSRRREGGE